MVLKKIKPEDLEILRERIGPLDTIERREMCMRGEYPGRVHDLEKIYRWTLLSASGLKLGDGVIVNGDINLYAYLDERGIDAALQSIVKPLTSPKPAIREDGTIKGLVYCKAATRRGAVLSFTAPSRKDGLRTSYIVDRTDFRDVYERMTNRIADYYLEPEASPVRAAMKASADAFLKRNNLRLVEVKYEQVVPEISSSDRTV